jgi:hypothetical protein
MRNSETQFTIDVKAGRYVAVNNRHSMPSMNDNDFSVRIRAAIDRYTARHGRKVTQTWLAEKMGCTRENVNIMMSAGELKRNAAKSHKADLILRAAETLEVDPYWLYYGERSMEPLVDASKYDERRMRSAIAATLDYLTKQKLVLGANEQAELIALIYRLNIEPESAPSTISSILSVTRKRNL